MYNEAVSYFKSGLGNGNIEQLVYYMHPGYLGQGQESGRDQGHSSLNVALLGVFCQMAYNQGDDLFACQNNRVLSLCEYFAKFNLENDVPYLFYANCDGVVQSDIGGSSRGNNRPCWDLIYNHYVNLKGIAAPWSTLYAARVRPEGGGGNYGGDSGGYDQLGFTTLTCSLDPVAVGTNPSGLTAKLNGPQQVLLQWWGTANATNYLVKRATGSGGSYTTIATITNNLLLFADKSVTNGGTHFYTVSALTPVGETGNAKEASVTVGPQLVAHYNFDQNTGTTAADATGHRWIGTLMNGATWVAGHGNNAVNLNGNRQYVSLPNCITTNLTDFTIATWVYLNGAPAYWARVFDFGVGNVPVRNNPSTPTRYMFFTPNAGDGALRFAITLGSSLAEQHIGANTPLSAGQWHHLAVTLAGTSGKLYVDGLEVGANTITITPSQLGTTTQNWIGRSQFSDKRNNDPYLNAKLDDFRIYSGALSPVEIAVLAGIDPARLPPPATENAVPASTPPMGWNSYDAFGTSITETEVLANAQYMQKNLRPHGWAYVVIDARWYDSVSSYDDRDFNKERTGAKLFADEFGRLLPAPDRFPSGFIKLAEQLHGMGLKFGVHMMRGIPRQAVKAGTRIEGSPFTAADAGDTNNICSWCPDMFGVRDNAAGQAWYDSVFRLAAAWGLDFVKVDDLTNPYSAHEIAMIRRAIDKCGRKIVFSGSAGPVPVAQAEHLKANANMWRISGDFWDRWEDLNKTFDHFAQWQGVAGPGHWPDADMIPFGHLGIKNTIAGGDRQTRFTKNEQVTLMTLWALAPSPLMLGANLPDLDGWTLSLLTNDEVLSVNQDPLGKPATRVSQKDGLEIWRKELQDGSAVGFFNRSEAPVTVKLPAGRDLWRRQDVEEREGALQPHASMLLKVKGK